MLSTSHWTRLGVSLFVLLGVTGQVLQAQENLPAPTALGAPVTAKTLTLQECIAIGLEKQPAVVAARASLAAAQANKRGVDGLVLAGLIARDLPIRRHQAALGVDIAAAGVLQAEWDARYAITRTYFAAVYARLQTGVVREAIGELKKEQKKAEKFWKDQKKLDEETLEKLKAKVEDRDLDRFSMNLRLLEVREVESTVGEEKALAALREAMGVGPECVSPADLDLPGTTLALDRCQLVALGLARRGEIAQTVSALQLTSLEIDAQGKTFMPTARTFAAASDVHSRPIPQGIINSEYRPGAIGIEMPTLLVGHRHDRMERARDLHVRAGAVAEKTQQLIALEIEALYHKWQEADRQARLLEDAKKNADTLAKQVAEGFELRAVKGEEVTRTAVERFQVHAQVNEARFIAVLGLAGLERATAGGFLTPWASPVTHP